MGNLFVMHYSYCFPYFFPLVSKGITKISHTKPCSMLKGIQIDNNKNEISQPNLGIITLQEIVSKRGNPDGQQRHDLG